MNLRHKATLLAVLSAAIVASPASHAWSDGSVSSPPNCTLPAADSDWINQALIAWHMARHQIAGIAEIGKFQALFFSADCVVTSSNALTEAGIGVTWQAERHTGTITLPDGDAMPTGVTSFTSGDEGGAYFVMSTPSVWRAGGVDGGALGLETLMIAVLLHEGSHVAQSATYGSRISALEQRFSLPESFSDDSLQARFESEDAFTASVAQETELFFEAAAAVDDISALKLARQARGLMRARADRWFTGDEAYWREAEDIWLTFEGSGQWVGYTWLISDIGGAVPVSSAIPGFAKRSRWWSQNQGLAIALTLDRLGGPGWRSRAFGDGSSTLLEMLDAALSDQPARAPS